MEVDVHAAEAVDQPGQMFRSIVAGDIQRFDFDLIRGFGAEFLEGLDAAAGSPHAPTLTDAESGGFETEAGGGSDDDDAFHGVAGFGLRGQDTTCRRDLQLPAPKTA